MRTRVSLSHAHTGLTYSASLVLSPPGKMPAPGTQNGQEALSSDAQGSSESASHRHVTGPRGTLRLLPSYGGKDAEC